MNYNDLRAATISGPTEDVFKTLAWLADHTLTYTVTMICHNDGAYSNVEALITFSDPNEALLFKIAWAVS